MNRYQKIAWFNLVVIATTVLVTSVAIAVEFHLRGYSSVGWLFIGILVLLKFTPLMFKKPQSPGGAVCDERDALILKRAASYAWTTFWWVLFASSFLLFFLIGPEKSVPTLVLPLIAFGGGLVHKTVSSVAILVQYGRTGEGDRP